MHKDVVGLLHFVASTFVESLPPGTICRGEGERESERIPLPPLGLLRSRRRRMERTPFLFCLHLPSSAAAALGRKEGLAL